MAAHTVFERRPTVSVPCRGCTACCRADAIMLHPEWGDDVDAYQTVPITNRVTGKAGRMLAKKPGTMDCIYLGENGCTIHDRAPVVCREFDCGRMFAKWSRQERRRLVKNGLISQEVFNQGRRVQAERGEEFQ